MHQFNMRYRPQLPPPWPRVPDPYLAPPTAPTPTPFVWNAYQPSTARVLFAGHKGVYVVWLRFWWGRIPIDVGQSGDVGDRLTDHPRESLWLSRQRAHAGYPIIEIQLVETPKWGVDPLRWRFDTERELWNYLVRKGYWLCGDRP